jgi:hypothetical protein
MSTALACRPRPCHGGGSTTRPPASRRRTRSAEPRHRRLTLGQDWGALWAHPAASAARKKRLRRPVRQEMLIETRPEPPEPLRQLHWHGGGHTEGRGVRHPGGQHGRAPPQQALAGSRARSHVCRDQTLAATLHRLG